MTIAQDTSGSTVQPAGDAPPTIDGYEIQRETYRTGHCVVYEALQIATQRRVAVKTLARDTFATDAAWERFDREIQIAATIDHPNLAVVHAGGVDQSHRPYVVMSWIDGASIDEHVLRAGLDAREIVSLLIPVCKALSETHTRGIIHGDVKPANILIDVYDTPHVVDFGFVRAPAPSSTEEADESSILEMLGCASPEHVSGDPDSIDARSDVYGLGVVLYELLCYAPPYRLSDQLDDAVHTIKHAEPQRMRSVAPRQRAREIDAALESIVLRSLEKKPAERYADARELGNDLQSWLDNQPVEARRITISKRFAKTARRHPVWFAVATIALVSIVTTGAYLWNSAVRDAREAQRIRAANVLDRVATVDNPKAALKLIDTAISLDAGSWKAYFERATRQAPLHLREAERAAQDAVQAGEDGAQALSREIAARFSDFERAVELTDVEDEKAQILVAAGGVIRDNLAQGASGHAAWWFAPMDAYYARAASWSDDVEIQLLPLRARSTDSETQVEAAQEIARLEEDPHFGELPAFQQIRTQVYLGGPYAPFPIEHPARDLEQALAAADRWANSRKSDNGYAWYMLGHVNVALQRWSDAIPALESAVALLREGDFDPPQPDNHLASALADLATCHARNRDYERAAELFAEALDLSTTETASSRRDGRSPIIAFQWAEAAHGAGDPAEAKRLLRLAFDIVWKEGADSSPSRVIPTAWTLLTFADPTLRDPDAALELITRMRNAGHMTNEPAAVHVTMLAYARLGNPRKTLALADELQRAGRGSAYPQAILALSTKARSHYNRARDRAAELDDAQLSQFVGAVALEINATD